MSVAVHPPIAIRALKPADLADVVAIDAAIAARPRRNYIERRLAAAVREPALHVQLAAVDDRGLAGYMLARVLDGEFGSDSRVLRLELLGVRPDVRGHDIGRQLLAALERWAMRHQIHELQTAASWNDHRMIGWLGATGFELAPAHIVDCASDTLAWRPERDDAMRPEYADEAGREIDFSADPPNDYERAARGQAEVRTMVPEDLGEIVRCDRSITGRDRSAYIGARLVEALDDSAVRVSLSARVDDTIVGYLMARADLGDYGRTEPVALIDTIGIAPGYEGRGVGRAMMAQLFSNLGSLGVERVESLVAPSDLRLLGFLYHLGFAPSQRLPFVRQLAG